MKGTLVPIDQTAATYTDVNDQDWHVAVDILKGAVTAALAGTPNMYQKQPGETQVRSDSMQHAAEGIDGWVDDWNAGNNPGPRLTVNEKPQGSVLPLLLLLALVVLSDGKGRRR